MTASGTHRRSRMRVAPAPNRRPRAGSPPRSGSGRRRATRSCSQYPRRRGRPPPPVDSAVSRGVVSWLAAGGRGLVALGCGCLGVGVVVSVAAWSRMSRPSESSCSVAVRGGAIRKTPPMPGSWTMFICGPSSRQRRVIRVPRVSVLRSDSGSGASSRPVSRPRPRMSPTTGWGGGCGRSQAGPAGWYPFEPETGQSGSPSLWDQSGTGRPCAAYGTRVVGGTRRTGSPHPGHTRPARPASVQLSVLAAGARSSPAGRPGR